MIMTVKRKVFVNLMATIAFIVLFLLPLLGLMTTNVTADVTAESAGSHTGDYVFFIVQQDEVPLAAVPDTGMSPSVLYIALAYFSLMMLFVYVAWYMSVRRNMNELSARLLPGERNRYMVPQGFFHPIRCYRLSKEAEDAVASTWANFLY